MMHHGADAFKQKCQITGKTTYELAMKNKHDAMSLDAQNFDSRESIECKIIDVLRNTK